MGLLDKISFIKKYRPIKDPLGNYKEGIFFVHVPKTGGTSIAKTLGLTEYTHIKAWEVIASGNRVLLNEKFSFGVVRNPFDRFISLYNYARMPESFYHDNLVEPENPLLPRHLDHKLLKNSSITESVDLLLQNKLKHDLEWNQWLPQYTWLYDKTGKKQLVQKIYKMENLEELRLDLNEMGYSIEKFPKLNTSKKQNYHKLIDSTSRNILEKYYQKDLRLFNYNF